MTALASSTKAYKGLGMEGGIARWYASLTRKSLDEFRKDARRMAEIIPPGGKVLKSPLDRDTSRSSLRNSAGTKSPAWISAKPLSTSRAPMQPRQA